MKNNWKTKIKVKKHEMIMLSEGYVVIDANYLIRADLVEFDNPLLQDKLMRGEEFNYNTGKLIKSSEGFRGEPPKVLQLIPPLSSEMYELADANLTTEYMKVKEDLYYNYGIGWVFLNKDYMTELKGAVDIAKAKWYGRTPTSIVCCYDNGLKCLAGIMPIDNRDEKVRKYLCGWEGRPD